MVRPHDDAELVREQRPILQPLVALRAVDDREIDPSVEQRRNRRAGHLRHDLHLDPGELLPKALERPREPVIAGVALGAEPQHRLASAGQAAERLLGGEEGGESLAGGLEQAQPGDGGHHALAHPQEELGAEPALEVEELVTQGGLGEVELSAGPGETAVLGDGGNQAQVADFEDHSTSL